MRSVIKTAVIFGESATRCLRLATLCLSGTRASAALNDIQQDARQDALNDTQQDAGQDALNDTQQDARQDALNDTQQDARQDALNDTKARCAAKRTGLARVEIRRLLAVSVASDVSSNSAADADEKAISRCSTCRATTIGVVLSQ
jgi:hypothetical protein